MFCPIAIVFNDHQRLERVYQFYTKYCIYYSYCSNCRYYTACTIVTIVYAVLCVKLIYSPATPEHHYATPQRVATPSLESPGVDYYTNISWIMLAGFSQLKIVMVSQPLNHHSSILAYTVSNKNKYIMMLGLVRRAQHPKAHFLINIAPAINLNYIINKYINV